MCLFNPLQLTVVNYFGKVATGKEHKAAPSGRRFEDRSLKKQRQTFNLKKPIYKQAYAACCGRTVQAVLRKSFISLRLQKAI